MAFRIFLDANVILDATLQRKGVVDALRIISAIEDGKLQASTTPAVMHVCSYFMRKNFSNIWIREFLFGLVQHVSIIEINHDHAVQAIRSSIDDLEDALQYHAALQHKLDIFLSSDAALKRAAYPGLPVITPQQFVRLHL